MARLEATLYDAKTEHDILHLVAYYLGDYTPEFYTLEATSYLPIPNMGQGQQYDVLRLDERLKHWRVERPYNTNTWHLYHVDF